jgi:hypothetical protein
MQVIFYMPWKKYFCKNIIVVGMSVGACARGYSACFSSGRGLLRRRKPAALASLCVSQSTTQLPAHFSFNFNRLIPLLQHILIQLLGSGDWVVLQRERASVRRQTCNLFFAAPSTNRRAHSALTHR